VYTNGKEDLIVRMNPYGDKYTIGGKYESKKNNSR